MGDAVTQDEINIFLDDLQSAFYSGDVEKLLDFISLPLVVYSVAGVALLRDKSEFTELVNDYRAALIAMEVVRGVKTIEVMESPVNNRQRVTVRNIDYNEAGKEVTGSLIRYFLAETPRGFVIEMLEYIEAPLPIETVEHLVH